MATNSRLPLLLDAAAARFVFAGFSPVFDDYRHKMPSHDMPRLLTLRCR